MHRTKLVHRAARGLAGHPRIRALAKRAYFVSGRIASGKQPKVVGDAVSTSRISPIFPAKGGDEFFFGYYDKTPDAGAGAILGHRTHRSTRLSPDPKLPIDVVLMDEKSGRLKVLGCTVAYNWQQGARAQWLSPEKVIYNDFDHVAGRYVARTVIIDSLDERTLDYPVQDAFRDQFYLTIDYGALSLVAQRDYGYRNIARKDVAEKLTDESRGIRKVDLKSGMSQVIHSMADIERRGPARNSAPVISVVNHVMIRPDGNGFIFVHRSFGKYGRHDVLMYSDFRSVRVLIDSGMVSHYCWLSDRRIFGYMKVNDTTGYFEVDIETGSATECEELRDFGDGHPTALRDLVVFDSYPRLNGMQGLWQFDLSSREVRHLADFQHSVSYWGETRCDLHPRFGKSGDRVFVDSVCLGARNMYAVDLIG